MGAGAVLLSAAPPSQGVSGCVSGRVSGHAWPPLQGLDQPYPGGSGSGAPVAQAVGQGSSYSGNGSGCSTGARELCHSRLPRVPLALK